MTASGSEGLVVEDVGIERDIGQHRRREEVSGAPDPVRLRSAIVGTLVARASSMIFAIAERRRGLASGPRRRAFVGETVTEASGLSADASPRPSRNFRRRDCGGPGSAWAKCTPARHCGTSAPPPYGQRRGRRLRPRSPARGRRVPSSRASCARRPARRAACPPAVEPVKVILRMIGCGIR